MAQKVTVQLVDDVDGSEAESTVEFALDGVSYTIDLSSENAAELRDALAPYLSSARRVGGRKRSGKANKTGKTRQSNSGSQAPKAADRERNQAIREWARQQGMQVSDRGRIPAEIVEAYDKAQ
ncbi:Lsr2 protein [Actinopolyspora mzabensis]|uniref:Lsr2 protein n=1 Tax=Actinopolyspora mzabensis TaxID=995066 RepID=A0A1G9FLJ1_ACTMZ|nr:Lsr2 family protein [Actinopolyspora mzabensis]SDK89053.1 Lsr2 protein [Actinopolyspora mzabensis]